MKHYFSDHNMLRHNVKNNKDIANGFNKFFVNTGPNLAKKHKTADEKKTLLWGVFRFKKAFDTMDHELLLKKLDHYGIRAVAYYSIKSYLKNRKQFVNIENCDSGVINVVCGVPQR